MRCKIFAGVDYISFCKPCLHNGLVQRERSGVVLYGVLRKVSVVDEKVAQHLKTAVRCVFPIAESRALPSAFEVVVHEVLRFGVFAFEKQLPDLGQVADRPAVDSIRIFASRLHGNVVENDMFSADASIGHHAYSSVAQRKCFFPYPPGLVVPQGESLLCIVAVGCAAAQYQTGKKR